MKCAVSEIDRVTQQKAQLVQQTVEIGNELGEAISMFGLDDAPTRLFCTIAVQKSRVGASSALVDSNMRLVMTHLPFAYPI